jgi:hypothetical protein
VSKIIKEFETKIPFTDHVNFVEVTNKKGETRRTLRTNNDTVLPKGIYTLWLEGTEDKEGFGMLYLGISGTDKQTAREGVKNRWYAHAQKMTGQFKGAGDTELFREFRKDLVAAGYDLDTVLDKMYFRFINLKGVGVEKIAAMETRILETRIAKGQCRLNGAKRKPALTIEELEYFDNI